MRRLPVIAALIMVALVGASIWLAIEARSDPEPLPRVEHLPRDDEQSQQQESQVEPEPDPNGDDVGQQSAEQDPSDEDAPAALQAEEETEAADSIEPTPDPVDVLIEALDVPRPLIEPAVAPALEAVVVVEFDSYLVEQGDTLADIAERLGIDLHGLISANELEAPDLLHVGQELAIPHAVVIGSVAEPEPLPESVEVEPAITENGNVYGTIRDHERGVINSATIAPLQTDTSVRLVEACIDGVRRTYIMGLSLPQGAARIYWRFDEGPLNTDRWEATGHLVEAIRWHPLLNTQGEGVEASEVWVRIGGRDLTFALASQVPDSIRGNFSICGR